MVEDRTNNYIIEMMVLSEDISFINFKLKELVRTLHTDPSLLGNTKEISARLFEKVKKLDRLVASFKPTTQQIAKMGTPSYVEGNIEPQRIVPGINDEYSKEIEMPLVIAEKLKNAERIKTHSGKHMDISTRVTPDIQKRNTELMKKKSSKTNLEEPKPKLPTRKKKKNKKKLIKN